MIALGGILAPLVTPFDRVGEVDGDAFVANVRAHLDAGLHGVVVAGSTGEAASTRAIAEMSPLVRKSLAS